jgi:hypothetical protein
MNTILVKKYTGGERETQIRREACTMSVNYPLLKDVPPTPEEPNIEIHQSSRPPAKWIYSKALAFNPSDLHTLLTAFHPPPKKESLDLTGLLSSFRPNQLPPVVSNPASNLELNLSNLLNISQSDPQHLSANHFYNPHLQHFNHETPQYKVQKKNAGNFTQNRENHNHRGNFTRK